MELRTVGGKLVLGDAFKLTTIGSLIGTAVIFVPFFLLFGLLVWVISATQSEPSFVGYILLLQLIMLPIVLVMQAIMTGAMVTLGLWIYRWRRPIKVVPYEPAAEA